MKTKSAMITIAGRPNVGKSTLTNALVGEKIAIVSHKPQTTRNRICAILNRKDTQLVFIDTPGFHRPRTKLGDYMVNVVKESIVDVDAILLIVEPIANVGEQELALIEQCKAAGAPTILVINKIDTVEKEALLPVIAAYSAHMDFASVIPSAPNGTTDLARCSKSAKSTRSPVRSSSRTMSSPTCPKSRSWPRSSAKAAVEPREGDPARHRCRDHKISPSATTASSTSTRRSYCEKQSHKGIIIGTHGDMLKKISSAARADCERFMGTKVYLQTWVRVKEHWRDSDYLISNFGYSRES